MTEPMQVISLGAGVQSTTAFQRRWVRPALMHHQPTEPLFHAAC